MIDHTGVTVSDYEKAKAFYTAALAPLGYVPMMAYDEHRAAGFGVPPKPDFWIQATGRTAPTHVAFRAETRADVDAFFAAAVAAGGKDNGGPGLRPQYHPGYYAAFVLDADGNNVEAVCHSG